MKRFPILLIAAAAVACTRADADDARARMVIRLTGFDFPESVRYDPAQDIWFVSNMAGPGSVKDGRGYISVVSAEDPGSGRVLVQGGENGVVLDAPKGMALQDDTLWVADIDVVRGFHRRTGRPVGAIDLNAFDVVMLNDVALGPDGSLYVTDTGIIMSPIGVAYRSGSKIFRITPGRHVSVFAQGDTLMHPNGMTWDSAGMRWVVVTFHLGRSEAYELDQTGRGRATIAYGNGRWDGVEALDDGTLLVTSWSDSSVHRIHEGEVRPIVRGVWQPADLGLDTRRRRIAVPLVLQGRVEIWELPR